MPLKAFPSGIEMNMNIERDMEHVDETTAVPALIKLKRCKRQPRFVSEARISDWYRVGFVLLDSVSID